MRLTTALLGETGRLLYISCASLACCKVREVGEDGRELSGLNRVVPSTDSKQILGGGCAVLGWDL